MAHSASSSTGAQRTYARNGSEWDYSNDLDPVFLRRFYEEWESIEEQIRCLQDHKKTMLAAIRSRYGRHQAEAVRVTMRTMMMEPLKRAEHFHFNETARRYVELIEVEGEHVQ